MIKYQNGRIYYVEKLSIEDRVKQLNEILDRYEDELGLPKFVPNNPNHDKIKEYLNMSREVLEALSPISCAEIATMLVNYSIHVQRASNRENAVKGWAEKSMGYYIAPKVKNYRGSFDHQEMQAIREDDYSQKLLSIITKAQERIDRLSFVANGIKSLAEQLKLLQMAKLGKT